MPTLLIDKLKQPPPQRVIKEIISTEKTYAKFAEDLYNLKKT